MMKIKINNNYLNLKESYLFSEIAKRVKEYSSSNPDKEIVRLGIGDVTLPLPPVVTNAMQKAVEEMANKDTFRGYAPEYGYDFLRDAISKYYSTLGVKINSDEIFVSDGAKSDVGNIVDIFGDNTVLIPDPVYPVYLDSNIMSGRHVQFLNASSENGFLPMPEGIKQDSYIIYICSPNNPTGAVYTRDQLKEWITFANNTGSLIIFDSAYEAFISGNYPHSIFDIDGARTCSIEICSFSKTAGFTGTRCAWTVVPNELMSNGVQIKKLWQRRQATKFNGVCYIVQRGAEAALSDTGINECKQNISYYMQNAALIAEMLTEKNIFFTGGTSSPYIWLRCPDNMKSWDFFDMLLNKVQVVGTPGAGFGDNGEGYFRLTSFADRQSTIKAVERLRTIL